MGTVIGKSKKTKAATANSYDVQWEDIALGTTRVNMACLIPAISTANKLKYNNKKAPKDKKRRYSSPTKRISGLDLFAPDIRAALLEFDEFDEGDPYDSDNKVLELDPDNEDGDYDCMVPDLLSDLPIYSEDIPDDGIKETGYKWLPAPPQFPRLINLSKIGKQK